MYFVAFAILATAGVQITIDADQEKQSLADRYAGVLSKEGSSHLPPVGPYINLQLGRSATYISMAVPMELPDYLVGDKVNLRVNVIDGDFSVSARFLDQDGDLVAEILNNEWRVNRNAAYDRNYSDDAIEVRDSRGKIVVQLRLLADCVQYSGTTYGSNGHVYMVEGNPKRGAVLHRCPPADPDDLPDLKPIFRYPSELHLGELAPADG